VYPASVDDSPNAVPFRDLAAKALNFLTQFIGELGALLSIGFEENFEATIADICGHHFKPSLPSSAHPAQIV
jgi:hypothetical protein